MGIRFNCSACGHKLNVKAFLAGRRGLCPYCGGKIQIPYESTGPSAKEVPQRRGTPAGTEDPGHGTTRAAGPEPSNPSAAPSRTSAQDPAGRARPAAASSPLPQRAASAAPSNPAPQTATANPATPASPLPGAAPTPSLVEPREPYSPVEAAEPLPPADATQPEVFSSFGQSPAEVEPESVGAPSPDDPIMALEASLDPRQPPSGRSEPANPLAEAPDAVWYVRAPNGGQFGPASGDVMRTWLAEGRVSPDALVWREGWRDWQEASRTFPQLGGGNPQFHLASIAASGPSSAANATTAHRPYSRNKSSKTNAVIITVLIVAMVPLLAVLIWVLSR